jgi:hypothetical protein
MMEGEERFVVCFKFICSCNVDCYSKIIFLPFSLKNISLGMGQFCFFKWFISYKYYLRIYLFFKKIHYLFTSKVKKKIEYFTNDFFFLLKYN